MSTPEHGHSHDHHHHGHGHANEHDQGFSAMLRYAKHARSMWSSEVNEAVVAQLAPTSQEHVADIGAGVGAGAVVAAATAGHVFAVEPTNYMRRILSARSRTSRHPFSVVDGSAESTGLPTDSVHVVLAVNTMHHWTDMDAACIELTRILRPGGRMLLVDENFEDPTHPDHEEWTARQRDGGGHSHHFHMVDTESIAAKFEAAGLVVAFQGERPISESPAWVVETSK